MNALNSLERDPRISRIDPRFASAIRKDGFIYPIEVAATDVLRAVIPLNREISYGSKDERCVAGMMMVGIVGDL